MCTATHDFELTPSRWQLLLQAGLLLVMLLLWWQMLQPLWLVLCTLFALLSWRYWLGRAQVTRLAQLVGQEWTLQWQAAKPRYTLLRKTTQAKPSLQRCQLNHVFDHSVYMLLKFDAHLNVIIWRDQVSVAAWKQLKILAKLY